MRAKYPKCNSQPYLSILQIMLYGSFCHLAQIIQRHHVALALWTFQALTNMASQSVFVSESLTSGSNLNV